MPEAHALYRGVGFTDIPPSEGREFADIPGAEGIQVFMALQLNDPRDRIRRSVGGLECLGPVAERVLTLRELNRATLARQLLLQRTRLSPTAVIERLVGMQAQSPQAPYVGIWTRTTGFRRGSLERLLRRSAIVRATATRQTLHLVTPRDYALIWAAMSETNFPWETERAKQLALSVRALAADRPVTSTEAIAQLESEYGLAGVDARRAWRMARVAALIVHHHETALWQPRNDRRFVAIAEPQPHVPVEARAEIFRRYLAAFGPSTRRDIGAWSRMRVAEIDAALELLEPLRRFRDEQGRELLDVPRAAAAGRRDSRRPSASCRSGTTSCSPGPTARACSRRPTGRR